MEQAAVGSDIVVDGVSLAEQPARALLPSRAFTSQQLFEAELEHVFERSWVHVADLPELTRSGDYVTGQVGRVPVLIVRDEQGELRGFVNSCRHRGATVAEGRGNCGKHLRCPYHAWTYATDGRLTGVPYREEFGERVDGIRLAPVRVATAGPLVFACLDERTPSFDEWAGELVPALASFAAAEMEPAFEFVYDVPANWKVYVENALDGYHVQFVHDVLPGILGRLMEGENRLERYASATRVPLDSSLLDQLLGARSAAERQRDFVRFGNLLPNFIPVLSPFELSYLRIDPVGVDALRLVARSFDHGGKHVLTRDVRRATFDRTNQQDIEIAARVQRGHRGGRVSPLAYAENLEQRIGHFERALVRELRAGLAGGSPADQLVRLRASAERGALKVGAA